MSDNMYANIMFLGGLLLMGAVALMVFSFVVATAIAVALKDKDCRPFGPAVDAGERLLVAIFVTLPGAVILTVTGLLWRPQDTDSAVFMAVTSLLPGLLGILFEYERTALWYWLAGYLGEQDRAARLLVWLAIAAATATVLAFIAAAAVAWKVAALTVS